eukprot:1157783-Pelagomonas_calceolata.AAC.2
MSGGSSTQQQAIGHAQLALLYASIIELAKAMCVHHIFYALPAKWLMFAAYSNGTGHIYVCAMTLFLAES